MNTERDCFQIAHLNISDAVIIAVFVDASFDADTAAERQRVYLALQERVWRTNPGADVVIVWQDFGGRTKFIAPVQQQRFFEVMKYDQLYAQADGTIMPKPS